VIIDISSSRRHFDPVVQVASGVSTVAKRSGLGHGGGELGAEIFVDPAEHVARSRAQPLGGEDAHHVFKDAAPEPPVILWQLAGERREGGFDFVHGGSQHRAEIAVLWSFQDHVEPRAFGKVQRPAACEVGVDQRAV